MNPTPIVVAGHVVTQVCRLPLHTWLLGPLAVLVLLVGAAVSVADFDEHDARG